MASALSTMCAQYDPDNESIGEFISRFEVQMDDALHKVRTSETKKAAILLRALPVRMVTDIQRRIAPVQLSAATYDQVKDNLLGSYANNKSTVGASVDFFSYKQEDNQSIEEYTKQLKFLASKCSFDQQITLDRLLRDVFVAGLKSAPILSSVLQTADSMSFQEAVDKAKLIEQIRKDTISIHAPSRIHATQMVDSNDVHKVTSAKKIPFNYICARCGQKDSHFVDKCFALKLHCKFCNKRGHLAKVCRSSKSKDNTSVHAVQGDHNENVHHVIPDTQKRAVGGASTPVFPSVATSDATPAPHPSVSSATSGAGAPLPTHYTPVSSAGSGATAETRSSCEDSENDIDHFLY